MADYDSPWKQALEKYFQAFMAFFFPRAHADINWESGYSFLDKELEKVVRDAELGKRLADKLAPRRRSGVHPRPYRGPRAEKVRLSRAHVRV
jgi:hypothetical protein